MISKIIADIKDLILKIFHHDVAHTEAIVSEKVEAVTTAVTKVETSVDQKVSSVSDTVK